jgi:hypothetical protein
MILNFVTVMGCDRTFSTKASVRLTRWLTGMLEFAIAPSLSQQKHIHPVLQLVIWQTKQLNPDASSGVRLKTW